jgi:molecular chaperone HtpG
MTENASRKGGISVETQHIFPIIKKWLYSDKDIFLREIVSNASDAVTKLKRLASLGHTELAEGEDFRITVSIDRDARTITVSDNGIGMTEDELSRYICSIALSGALEFIEKYEDGDKSGGIIGHFGLGFYSSFMVSDRVELHTRSYTGADAVHWSCDEGGEYEISSSDKESRGTTVIMHISEEESEYLEPSRIKGILDKYCAFMPVPIYFESGDEDESKIVNDTIPLWARNSSDISKEEYNEFYHKLFMDADDPLFYIHINADYPLNFKGVLYFPRIRNEAQSLEGEIKLFYNHVFVADNIKEVLPDYLLMLRGALDCPELPLNVSRSYLQDNAYVKKISQYIVKKVADKLTSLALNDRENYEKLYGDIRIFLEYACLRERKFYDRAKDSLLLRLTDGTSCTFTEYLDGAKDKHEGVIYYANDTALQSQYISMMSAENVKVALFDLMIDTQYMSAIEQYRDDVKFVRVDSGVASAVKSESEKTEIPEGIVSLFRKISKDEKLTVCAETLKNADVPALLSVSEESRRFEDMMRMYAAPGADMPAFPLDYTLTLNPASELYAKLIELAGDGEVAEDSKAYTYASFIYQLARLSQKKLTADELSELLSDGYKLLKMI